MVKYETIFSVGPDPAKKSEKKKLVELASTMIYYVAYPFGLIAGKSIGLSKLIYTSLARLFSLKNNTNYYRYELLWKSHSDTMMSHDGFSSYAIVMQGQIAKDDNFTENTLYHYRKMYPDATIILSTWDDEPSDVIERLKSKGIICICNKYPDKENYGRGNLNLQLINTKSGVEYAFNMDGIRYILKTRTDQRIYMNNFLQYFSDLLQEYPTSCDKLMNRLIFMNCEGASVIYYPFKLSDMLVFGHKDDMYNLYNIPLTRMRNSDKFPEEDALSAVIIKDLYALDYNGYKPELVKAIYEKHKDFRRFVKYKTETMAEAYILSNYINLHIREIKNEDIDYLQVYHDFIKQAAIIIDKTAIELFWKKYNSQYCKIQNNKMEGQLDHATWLNMYLKA